LVFEFLKCENAKPCCVTGLGNQSFANLLNHSLLILALFKEAMVRLLLQ